MSDKVHILLSGGAGYIGSHVYYALVDVGFSPVVIDNLSTGVRANLPEDALFYEGDIEDGALVGQILKDHDVQAIMHFAGLIDVVESLSFPEKYFKANVEASLKLLEAAVNADVRNFVFSSTAAVYGEPDDLPVSEGAPCDPVSPYGLSKKMFEDILAKAEEARGIKSAVLRYFNVAGADADMRTGPSENGPQHVVKAAVSHFMGRSPSFKIFGKDHDTRDGTCIRDFIHVSDLASIHVLALEDLMKSKQSFTMNCGYGRGVSIAELADELKALDKTGAINIVYADARDGDVSEIYADITSMNKRFNWRPKFDTMAQILKSEIAWQDHKVKNAPQRNKAQST